MHYSYEIDISPDNTVSNPLELHIKLAAGIILSVDFLFEVGDRFSSCVTLWDNAVQILPSNSDGWYSADGLLINAPVYYKINERGNDLYVIAWNRGGVYDHTVTMMISVESVDEPKVMELIKSQNGIFERLLNAIKEIS
jgi:hypothetical protein